MLPWGPLSAAGSATVSLSWGTLRLKVLVSSSDDFLTVAHWQQVWGGHWRFICQFLFHPLICHAWSVTDKGSGFLSSRDLLSCPWHFSSMKKTWTIFSRLLSIQTGTSSPTCLAVLLDIQSKAWFSPALKFCHYLKLKRKLIPAWNWLTAVYQAPGINPEEMDTSEIAFIFFQDIQELIYTLVSSIPKSWEYSPKMKKLRARISPHLLVVVHKVSFHLDWEFFFPNDFSYASHMALVAKDAALLVKLLL